MHKLIAILALSTSVLAVTSIYLWIELRDARDQMETLREASAATPSSLATQAQHRADPVASAATSQAAAQADMSTSPGKNAEARQKLIEEEYRDSSRRLLTQLSDPAMRAEMVEEWKEANLPNKAKYVRYLGISEGDAERLIDVLAEQNFLQSELFARCSLQPRCDFQALSRQSNAAKQLAITDLLGAATQQRFEQYTYTSVERNMVSSFLRDKIPAASQLSDEQAEQLISALADERKVVETEVKQRGLEPFNFPVEGVAFTFQESVFAPGNTSERLKEAAEYNRRIHARAKAMLTSQQLAAFEEMQERAIVSLKGALRRQERELATQAANEQK